MAAGTPAFGMSGQGDVKASQTLLTLETDTYTSNFISINNHENKKAKKLMIIRDRICSAYISD